MSESARILQFPARPEVAVLSAQDAKRTAQDYLSLHLNERCETTTELATQRDGSPVLHDRSSPPPYGKIGLSATGTSHAEADAMYARALEIPDVETGARGA